MQRSTKPQPLSAFPHDTQDVATNDNRRQLTFSICTLVTIAHQYGAMVERFRSRGFDGEDCEFLYIDNSSGNTFDAFSGINRFLDRARGKYVIVCHQDIVLLDDGFDRLQAIIRELDAKDPRWAVLGNAGGRPSGGLAIRISDLHGDDTRIGGPFPARAVSLDENFLVIRREARIGVSEEISGFHLYGTELCYMADVLGYSCYVVDFHLRHNGDGALDGSFRQIERLMVQRYARISRPRLIATTCTTFLIMPIPWLSRLANRAIGIRVARFITRASQTLGQLLAKARDQPRSHIGDRH